MTGNNRRDGLDVIGEGEARRVTDDDSLRDLAAAWEAKYGEEWHFDVAGGAFQHSEGEAPVFSITPVKADAYERDEPGGATRYRF